MTKKEIIDEDKEVTYYISHTYESNGKYIVKIYGSCYFSLRSISTSTSSEIADGDPALLNNLICRVLDVDLPIASQVTNLANFCNTSPRLLNLHIPSYYSLGRITNASSVFKNCINLISATGFKRQFYNANIIDGFFCNCTSLVTTDFTLPPVISRGKIGSIFNKCAKLQLKIVDIFPEANTLVGQIDIGRLFFRCGEGLDLTDCQEKLWNNKNVKWINTNYTFRYCPDNILAQVPKSWGGTADNSIIKKSVDETISLLEERIKVLEEKLASVNASGN